MKKILFMLAITLGLIFSSDAFAKFGRVGGFRSSGFRSYSYSRPSSARRVSTSHATSSSKAKAIKNSTNNTKTNALKSSTEKTASVKNSNTTASKTVSSTNTHTNTIIRETDSGLSAPMWFLIGHSTAQDRITVINNTNEKFSCNDCESLKNEKEVYNVCLKKCTK